ncbi:MAG: carbohydrate ABC transporter permease [Clostridia bacterium]|nr:carbohydrate ABC transporter permease [Clostridia bacterium]
MKKRETKQDQIFLICNTLFMIVLCVIIIYPVLYVIGRSFMLDAERAANPLSIIPRNPSLQAYRYIFMRGSYVTNAYMITILKTVVGTACNLVFTILTAYVLSQRKYPLKKALTMMVVFTMWFDGGIVPNYMLIRSLGLINNFWVYILPGLISAWNMLILRNFFMAIPSALIESATIDGANEAQILWKIVIPTSGAAIATIGLFYAVTHWNSWFDAVMYITDRKLWSMQVFLREIIRSAQVVDMVEPEAASRAQIPQAEMVQMATIVITALPIICVYPFVQKYFVKGVMIGSVKG